jgi:hypothetical protein
MHTSREHSGPTLFLAYINDIWRNVESKIRLFSDDCIIYREIINIKDIEKLQTDLDRRGEWAEGNEMKINPYKSKFVCKCVLYYCHRVATQLKLNISYQKRLQ